MIDEDIDMEKAEDYRGYQQRQWQAQKKEELPPPKPRDKREVLTFPQTVFISEVETDLDRLHEVSARFPEILKKSLELFEARFEEFKASDMKLWGEKAWLMVNIDALKRKARSLGLFV